MSTLDLIEGRYQLSRVGVDVSDSRNYPALGLEHLWQVFQVYMLGLGSASIAFGAELLRKRQLKRYESMLIKLILFVMYSI